MATSRRLAGLIGPSVGALNTSEACITSEEPTSRESPTSMARHCLSLALQ